MYILQDRREDVCTSVQEYYLVALSQPRTERLAELQLDANGKSLASKMVGALVRVVLVNDSRDVIFSSYASM